MMLEKQTLIQSPLCFSTLGICTRQYHRFLTERPKIVVIFIRGYFVKNVYSFLSEDLIVVWDG